MKHLSILILSFVVAKSFAGVPAGLLPPLVLDPNKTECYLDSEEYALQLKYEGQVIHKGRSREYVEYNYTNLLRCRQILEHAKSKGLKIVMKRGSDRTSNYSKQNDHGEVSWGDPDFLTLTSKEILLEDMASKIQQLEERIKRLESKN